VASWALFVIAVNMLNGMPMGPSKQLHVATYEECTQVALAIAQRQIQEVQAGRSTAIYLFACAERSAPDDPA
jgi:hypothetical protein